MAEHGRFGSNGRAAPPPGGNERKKRGHAPAIARSPNEAFERIVVLRLAGARESIVPLTECRRGAFA
jgi:hypothetical protein